MLHRIGLALTRLLAIMLVASLSGAMLIRMAPGFSSDEQELNPALSPNSIQAIRDAKNQNGNIPRFYIGYICSLLHGDLGTSESLNRSVNELLRQRLPVTATNLGLSLLLGWVFALLLAIAAQLVRARWCALLGDSLSSAFMSSPAAVLALIFLMLRWPPLLAAALLIFPKLYSYVRDLLQQYWNLPHVLAARARGAGSCRILIFHAAPLALPQLIALAGVSIGIGLSVMLPIEVICDVPGIGQLAWQAAQSRDLPLLVNLTLVITFVTVSGTMLSDAFRRKFTSAAA